LFAIISKIKSDKTGFAGIGKLQGAERTMIMSVASSYRELTLDYVGCEPICEEVPHFSMLSPHHRLSLIVEVVIGLVDDTAPLPPDTLEHYSAYFALYSFVFNQIEVEIDMHGNGSPEYQEQMFQPNKGDADRYGKAKSLDDPMADWNHQGPREDLEERKYNKQINKQLHSFEKHHTARNNTNNTNNSNGDSCSDTNSDRDRDVEGMDHNQKQLMSMLTRTWG